MIGQWVPAVRTPAAPFDVARAYGRVLTDILGKVQPITIAIVHAHGAFETGNFASCWCHGPGNIKASAKWTGLFTTIKLNELLERDGKKVYIWFDPVLGELISKNGPARYPDKPRTNPDGHEQCRMRAFLTLADGIRNKIEFLAKPHWRPVLEFAIKGDPAGYVHGLAERTYFTAREAPYARGVISLTKSLLPIATKAAMEPEPLPPEEDEQLCRDMAECHRFELPEWLRKRVAQITALTASEMWDAAAEDIRRGRDAAVRGDGDDDT
jgi:hypothetical protein